MKIIEINIIQFGKFRDRVFKLEDGFNIVKGDNESGKSTLLGFIKYALYGVGRKNPSVSVGERERAVSWNVGIAAGSLTLMDVDGKKYRIERNGRESAKGAFSDKARIIDLENGEEVFIGEVPGEHFLGINAQAYDSMCNIKQLEAVMIGTDAVKGVIDNLLSSGDENMNIQSALKTLDQERRRLMHTNGKGGLVYEREMELERLKNEHRGAIIAENEKIKNYNELESVTLSLERARDEFNIAQRMCDAYDDVARLEKFDELAKYKESALKLDEKSRELDASVDFDTSFVDYEYSAKIKSAVSSLQRSKESVLAAKRELEEAEDALSKISCENSRGFSEILEEFQTPAAAVAYLGAKKKKKNSFALALVITGIASAILIAFALALAFALSNVPGASTVGFIGLVLLVIAFASYKKFSAAKAEIDSFMKKMGEGYCPKNEEKILSVLVAFNNSISERTRLTNARESAIFRLGMAEDAYKSDLEAASVIALENAINSDENELCSSLIRLSERMSEYLSKRTALDGEIRENAIIIKSLSSELERYSERDIRARITPELREKISKVSFDQLKKEREYALLKTNQYNQYKAGIERNIAVVSTKRTSSDVFPEMEMAKDELASLKLRLDAVKLASETIEKASSDLKSDVTPRIRSHAETNLASITNGKYNELFIDEDMGLSIFADGATRPIDSLSKGSLDVAYFSVRLALLQSLLADKRPPLYMDETLSQLDDGRAENVIKTVFEHSKNAQCVLFTCQNRDVELARKISDVNLIEL